MMKLAEAAVLLVANGSTTQDFLRFFGRCFVRYFCHYGYEKFIKVGNNLSVCIYTMCLLSSSYSIWLYNWYVAIVVLVRYSTRLHSWLTALGF